MKRNMRSAFGDVIEIVCGTDINYIPHLGVLLRSIAVANRGQPIRAHILHDGVDETAKLTVAQCAPAIKLEWYEIADHQALGFRPLLQITRATYLRLTMTEVLPASMPRALFLDVDMTVTGKLLPLWKTDLKGNVCAAVTDPGGNAEKFASQHSLPLPGQYFNAGVLLLDLDKVRAGRYLERSIALLAEPGAHYEFADQDALNIVLWNQWLPLDAKWNFQRKFYYDSAASAFSGRFEPVIIHYTETFKPWRHDEWHPYAWIYLKNLLRTPYRRRVTLKGGIGWQTGCKWWLRYRLKRGRF